MSRRLLLAGTCLAGYVAALDNTVVAVALRDIQANLGAGVAGLQGVVTGYVVALAALLLAGGALADAMGRRRVLLTGLAVFAAASAGCAVAPAIGWLVAARCVQGVGAALVLPGGLALLAAEYPERASRAKAVGVWAAAGAFALVAGPVTGGLLVQAFGWRAVFWVNLPACAVAALLCLGRLRAPAADAASAREGVHLTGQLLVAAALGAATLAVVLAGRDGASVPVAAALVVAAALAGAFRWSERRTRHPVLPAGLLRDRAFLAAVAAAFAASLAVFVLLVFISLLLQLVRDLGPLAAAVRLLPLTAAVVVTAPLAARLGTWRGTRLPVTTGLVLCSAGLLGVAACLTGPAVRLELVLAVTGIGVGLTGAPVVTAALGAVARSREGLAAATVNVGRELGGVVAVAGLGALVVSRLSADLTDRLRALGTAPGPARTLVDLVLHGVTSAQTVLVRTHGTVGLDALLQLRSAATASYLASTRLALVAAGILVGAAAAFAGVSLPGPSSPRARGPRAA